MMSNTVTNTLRATITASAQTRYAIAKGAGVDQAAILRFMEGTDIKGATVDKLANYFGLELKPKARKR